MATFSLMDAIFLLDEGDRTAFLQQMMQSFGCSYICLWSYIHHPSSCLLAWDGLYQEPSDQPSSSSGSLARSLFDAYRQSGNLVDNGRIPGFAFKNKLPYIELKFHDLERMASNQVQLQFYREAGIKTAVFMGCATGEIELGMSNDARADIETEMKNLFPVDFSQPADPNQSSSSSLRSLSVDSPPEYSPLLFDIPTTSLVTEPSREAVIGQTLLGGAFRSAAPPSTLSQIENIPSTLSQIENIPTTLSQIRNIQLPTTEIEDAAMTKAILAVLSSPSTSSSTAQNLPQISRNPSAFRRYRAPIAPVGVGTRKQNMFKRAVLFFRNLNFRRIRELQIQGNRPTSTQLHHMISERRRREKLNESFQVLRSLLPPGSKKDKASVLSNTTEYLSSLKSQVEELRKRNAMLESQILAQKSEGSDQLDQIGESKSSSGERINVEISEVSSSTSEARIVDLRVVVRGERRMLDLLIRLLEFLNQQRDISLSSVESNTRVLESAPVHGIVIRLKIEGHEFDESGFREAVRRIIDDSLH